MHKLTGVFAVIVMCFANVHFAHAEPVYYFGFDQSNYSSSTGSYVYTTTPVLTPDGAVAYYTCTVNVYLYEYSAGTGQTYIAPTPPNAAEGLQSTGVALSQTAGTTNYTVSVANGSPGFTNFNEYLSSDLTGNQVTGVLSFQNGDTTTGVMGNATTDPQTTSLLVGTFTFQMPSDANYGQANPITFTTSDLASWMVDNQTFVTGTDLDALLNGSAPPILTVVPEPPSVVALSGLAAMGALMWVVRRARRFRLA